MPLYQMTGTAFQPLSKASFCDLKVLERNDLQRLLRTQIDVLGDELYVLTEEFGDWENSRRRIDLLAIDRQANLVVIELKRTTDGGHMELQAIRYAAMVSAMTFEKAEQIHGQFLMHMGMPAEDAQKRILTFLRWEEPDEESFARDVRIVLVSEDFGKELTSAVLWMRERDIDIRCIRLQPYENDGMRLVDVQQIIPLPEANEYQVQLREKEQIDRKMQSAGSNVLLKFWEGLVAIADVSNTRHADLKPGIVQWLAATSGIRGLSYTYSICQKSSRVELYIDRGEPAENKQIFDQLFSQKDEIGKAFDRVLVWERLDSKRACRIKHEIELGGYQSPNTEWPTIQEAMVEAMRKFEVALKPALESLEL